MGWSAGAKSCSGANVTSVLGALEAMKPFVLGRRSLGKRKNPAGTLASRHLVLAAAHRLLRLPRNRYGALGYLRQSLSGQPLYNLFGRQGPRERQLFLLLLAGSPRHIVAQAREGVAKGFQVFYLKVGFDIEAELEWSGLFAQPSGPRRKFDWTRMGHGQVNEALRNLARLDEYNIDFIEQPVVQDPFTNMQEVRRRCNIAVSANEGLWTAADADRQISAAPRTSIASAPTSRDPWRNSRSLSWLAHLEGLQICRHTHGELGITAAACHHILLTLPNVIDGNQQTAHVMTDDICGTVPITHGPDWGVPSGPVSASRSTKRRSENTMTFPVRGQFHAV